MAGDEEARARAVLAEMQLRISQGPTSALGIGEVVTPDEVRAAFLSLTKQFHPARFGRLSPDLQRLSNEVFLGIKAAHDHMLKVLGSSPAQARGGGGARSSSTAIPIVGEGTNRTATQPRGTQQIQRLDPGTQPPTQSGRISSPVMGGRTTTPVGGVPISRTATPNDARPITGGMPALPRTDTPQQRTGAIPIQGRPGTPPPSTGQVPRAGTPPPAGRPITPVPPGTQPGGYTPAPSTPPGGNVAPGTQPLPRSTTPVPPGTQPGVGTGSQRMVRIRTSTGAILNVPAGSAGNAHKTTPPGQTSPLAPQQHKTAPPGQTSPLAHKTTQPGQTSPLAHKTTQPGQTSPLAHKTTQPGQTSPLAHKTTQPGQTSPLAHKTTQPGQTSPLAHKTMPPGQTSPINPPTQPPRGNDAFNPPTVRNVDTSSAGNFDEASAFRECTVLMEQKNWPGARQALHNLAAKVPQNRTYRAWLCYARGREAYINGKPDEAILEMQRALQLEPDLAHAKHALAELQRRR